MRLLASACSSYPQRRQQPHKVHSDHLINSSFRAGAGPARFRVHQSVRARRGARRTVVASSLDTAMQMTSLPWLTVAGTMATGLGIAAFLDAGRKSRQPRLQAKQTSFNKEILSRCPSLKALYRACPFLTNGHVETIFAAICRRDPGVAYYRRCLVMSDGAAIALDYELLPPEKDLPADAPVVLLLPGLTGGSHDVYVQHMVRQCREGGYRAVVFNGRGTSDSPVTTPQFYSASYTEDTRQVTTHLQEAFPNSTFMAVGWSLGANILMRYLGEEGAKAPFVAAASLCNPFDLVVSNANFERGFNRFYDYRLAQSLSSIYKRHMPIFLAHGGDYDCELAAKCTTIRQFDDAITRVAFGWPSVDAYYRGSSSADSVPAITLPLLCIQAADDPIAPEKAIPYDALVANQNCILSVTPTGGHLGWVSLSDPLGAPAVHESVIEFFAAAQESLVAEPRAAASDVQLSVGL